MRAVDYLECWSQDFGSISLKPGNSDVKRRQHHQALDGICQRNDSIEVGQFGVAVVDVNIDNNPAAAFVRDYRSFFH
jgi:hypothetical protein